jgi:molybdopterin-containing oxidoreductase family membrane subunit
MVVLAVLGATLSFFHQGSLGGLYGVLQGRPFAFREELWVFPTTFFLFVLSAMAIGPAFLVLIARTFEVVTRRLLVPRATIDRLARLSGTLLLVYLAFKGIDTLVWLNGTVPETGIQPAWLYRQPPFGSWVLVAEFLVLGLVPALLLRRAAHHGRAMVTLAAVLGCAGIALNRLVATLQTLILPTLPFEETWAYVPNRQETVAFAGVIALAVIVLSLAHRADLLFGREPEPESTGRER